MEKSRGTLYYVKFSTNILVCNFYYINKYWNKKYDRKVETIGAPGTPFVRLLH